MRELQTKFPKGKVVRQRYIVEELLGTGGFGAVYRVRDRRVKTNLFALKELIEPNKYERESFGFECELLRRLDHPALPRVYRGFEDEKNNRLYMLMDYVDGINLEKLRQRQPEKRFALPQVLKMMAPIIAATAYLHAQNPPIIHRDIKPANIIVPTVGDGSVLVDFGIAKVYELESTTAAVRHCSPGYGAPEHYAQGTNTRTDIYSLAATFYTILTGTIPTDSLYRMTWLSSKGVDPLKSAHVVAPDVPPAVADVLTRAMAINSNDRFATVEEFWDALHKAVPESLHAPPQQSAPLALPPALPLADVSETPDEAPQTPRLAEQPPAQVIVRNVLSAEAHAPRRSILIFSLFVLALVALLSGALFGGGLWPATSSSHHAFTQKKVTTTVVAPPTAQFTPSPTPLPTPSPTPLPTPSPTPSPTPTPSSYPVLTQRYDGSISDKDPPTDTTMSLQDIEQHGTNITGYFSVGPGLIGDGNFAGMVTTDNKIQFLVESHGPILPLFFSGQIQANRSISGTYCSYENNGCNYNGGGYGDWKVSAG